tara:strand:+ start:1416 stop:1982 length:567 start_codon:yes stop_codon:yes gene_type:complete
MTDKEKIDWSKLMLPLDSPPPAPLKVKGIKVTLSANEVADAKALAKKRNDVNVRAGMPDSRVGKAMTSLEINEMGVLGEMAFTKTFGLELDQEYKGVRIGGHDTVDKLGRTIDVKTTRYANGQLRVLKRKIDHGVEMYALVIMHSDSNLTIKGGVHRAILFRPENIDGPNYAMNQHRLIWPPGWEQVT